MVAGRGDDLDSEVVMAEWQPIETAPKDGRAILIYEPSGHYGRLSNEDWDFNEHGIGTQIARRFDDYRFAIGYWRINRRPDSNEEYGGWGNRNCADVNPTHWMPLPDPPGDPL